jgi:hypothetical protein
MKSRNMLAGLLLMCQCGCGHTYFAWKKPLPVEQTETYPFPPTGSSDWPASPLWAGDLLGNDQRSPKEMQRDLERAVQTHFPKR